MRSENETSTIYASIATLLTVAIVTISFVVGVFTIITCIR